MKNLRAFRIKAGINQKQLGELTDISATQIHLMETGERGCSLLRAIRIADVLNASLDDICGRSALDFSKVEQIDLSDKKIILAAVNLLKAVM